MRSSVFIAIAVAVFALIWVASGVIGGQSKEAPAESAVVNEVSDGPVEVRIQSMTSETMTDFVQVAGRTQASRKVDLRAETSGQVVKVLFEKGAVVKEGQALAKIELRDRSARVEEAEQKVNQRQIQYTAAKELEHKGFSSKVRLAEASAELEAARAQLKQARVELTKTSIVAPYDGVVNNQYIEKGDFVSVGDMVFSVVDLDPLEISAFISEKNVSDIELGSTATAEFLTGIMVEGEVTYVASVADEQTRTFEIEISLPNPDHQIKEGLTAELKIPTKDIDAFKISPSVLSLADDGTIGVKVVGEGDKVEFVPVKLLQDTPDFIWVSGLPANARLITVGQEFVVEGQNVKPVPVEVSSTP